MKKIAAVYLIGLCLPVLSYADYQSELSLQYGIAKYDSSYNFSDSESYGFIGTYYFENITDISGPLNERGFLSKSSAAHAFYFETEGFESYGLLGAVVFGNDFVLSTGYRESSDDSAWSVGLGKYLNDSTAVNLSYSEDDYSEQTELTLYSVVEIGGQSSISYSIGGDYVDYVDYEDDLFDAGYSLFGELTYYPFDAFGFGASVTSDDEDNVIKGISTHYFFSQSFALEASATRYDDNVDQFNASATFRF